jgi:hypothetical protein
MINCNDCEFISLTEDKQQGKHIDHICLKHNERVYHKSNIPCEYHKRIYPCPQCGGNDFSKRRDGNVR